MRWFIRAACVAAMLATGSGLWACTLIYDAGDFRNRGAIEVAVEPLTVLEGRGSAGRMVPLILRPDNPADELEPEARLELAVFAGDRLVEDGAGIEIAAPSVDGAMMATAISVPVMPELGEGSALTVRLTIVESDRKVAGELKIAGLNELVDPAPGAALFPLYSTIEFGRDVNFASQPEPVRFAATASIAVRAKVSVDAEGQRAGAGGCDGGGAEEAGGCGPHGGRPGTKELLQFGGGGGGSNQGAGSKGNGQTTGGAAGEPVANDGVASLAQSRGNGGGGGADGDLLGSAGGAGGGGGGVIELSSEGTLAIVERGMVTATGGVGADGAAGGGRGGDGSGGVILVRAAGALTGELAERLAADGGDLDQSVGKGGAGFIRVDGGASSLALPAGATRGAMWVTGPDELPPIVRQEVIVAKLVGEDTQVVRVLVGDEPPVDVTLGTGATDVSLSLEPGLNTLCVLMTTTANPSLPEAKNCIDVAYVPEQPGAQSAAR